MTASSTAIWPCAKRTLNCCRRESPVCTEWRPRAGPGSRTKSAPKNVPSSVFVTAYDRYAVRAFEVHALDYLLKPFDRERFEESLNRVQQRLVDRDPAIWDRLTALLREARTDYLQRVIIRTSSGVFLLPTVDRHARLDPRRFRRIHRSSIVNLESNGARVSMALTKPYCGTGRYSSSAIAVAPTWRRGHSGPITEECMQSRFPASRRCGMIKRVEIPAAEEAAKVGGRRGCPRRLASQWSCAGSTTADAQTAVR